MPASLILAIITAGGLVSLLVVALRARGAVASWLAAFVADLIVWSTADAVHHVTGSLRWHALDVTTSPLTIPLGLGFVAAFAERSRELRPAVVVAFGWFGMLSLSSASAFVREVPVLPSHVWSAAFLTGIAGVVVLATRQLVQLMRRTTSDDERARARLVLIAMPFAAVFGATDILGDFIEGVPELASIGVLGSALIMGVVALRWRLFGRELSTTTSLAATGIGAIAVAVSLLAIRFFETSTAATVIANTMITAAVVVVTRQIVADAVTRRTRAGELSTLGRAAAQMAHDMKNPLAAIRGAADVLAEGLKRGEPAAELGELAEGIRADADRMAKLVEDYRRFVKVDPVLARATLRPLVRATARAAAMWAPPTITCVATSGTDDPELMLDAALIEAVLDGLARNAIEALGDRPGSVTLSVAVSRYRGVDGVSVMVDDDGPGMDAYTRGRATEDFFTTKATGSGLGLAFAARVAEAHRGALSLSPRGGGGTRATLWLPAVVERPSGR